MSLRQEVLKQIKVMLKEAAVDGVPEAPSDQSTTQCPANKIKIGQGTGGPICRDLTPAEKQGMEWGQKITDFTGDALKKGKDALQRILPNQSKGICPPGQEQTGEGPNGPICSPKGSPEVKKAGSGFMCGKPYNGKSYFASEIYPLQIQLNRIAKKLNIPGLKATTAATPPDPNETSMLNPSKGVDGKCGPDTVRLIKAIKAKIPNLKIDSPLGLEGQLRKIPSENVPNVPSPKEPGGEEKVGGKTFPAPMQESKNWVKRTKEEASSNLFERLVKDAAKSKVL